VRAGVAPLPAVLVHGGIGVVAFSTNDPVVLAACLAAAIALLAVSRAPWRLFATVAAVTGLSVALLNPLVSSQGDLILFDGPSLPLLDLQVTLEEVAYGLAMGTRIAATTLLCGAFLGIVDRDRLAAAVSRVAPRSALTVALAARMLPALRRDAQSIDETARLRGMVTGTRRDRLRGYAGLLEPLTASALERGMDHAEAMAARGYGEGARTAIPEPRLTIRERLATATGVAAAVLATASIGGVAPFGWYPTMTPVTAAAWLLGAGTLAVGLAAASLFRDRT
jgi:energy-coupling factor transporter transmembrane protein EcfT